MPQLQINQGPQDALLYDNTRSYFTNVGYVRTSNFQLELRDVDPQNTANLGSTVQFVIPKAADLLGPCDLMLQFSDSGKVPVDTYAAWVESVGFAMIERITFSVGSHDIETITGDQLNIMNELMRGDEQRLGAKIGKTGRGAMSHMITQAGLAVPKYDTVNGRIISYNNVVPTAGAGKKLIVPLGLFFTKHPSQYFPLAAIAGCNDVRIAIKFRTMEELIVTGYDNPTIQANLLDSDAAGSGGNVAKPSFGAGSTIVEGSCKLRCHYVHVTGPEATTLMNKEHVRLLKLWQVNSKPVSITGGGRTSGAWVPAKFTATLDLSFLHPVQELIITIRKASEMGSSTGADKPDAKDQKGLAKNYFAYHGGGSDPNIESWVNRLTKAYTTVDASDAGTSTEPANLSGAGGARSDTLLQATVHESFLEVENFKLTLNGQERHPSLASAGLDRDYLMNRLMPMIHSNTSHTFKDVATGAVLDGSELDFAHLGEMMDRKEIYVYPFALNPEGSNPSGAVNFSKVSHAKLSISGLAYATASSSGATTEDYVIDVYGIYYNWLQIKDGRALTSFA